MDSESNHQQVDVVSSPSVIYETIGRTLSSPSLPTLPFDLIPEILCRLSVKLLNSLISDPKFAKKQLRVSTVSLIHTLAYYANTNKYVWIKSYSLDSIFAKVTANPIAQLEFPLNHDIFFAGSCNGILCFLAKDYKAVLSFRLWNPSIRKFKELSPLRIPLTHYVQLYGFIHDPITDNYKVVVVLQGQHGNFVDNHEVKVHTLDTNSWKSIQKFPFGFNSWQVVGKCVSGTINWLVVKDYDNKLQHCIVSLHLGEETYKVV
ncbi:F-box protein interaction domain protein [Medicago truncatula]|uniref:F-box protein interaction domain protein n=1 Tax=Medicago truncatula TaxID=3880 RepID=A0A072V422_MEDTR|nr:F-box protein interaction domain protein [Medicago truncatula]